MSQRNHNYVNWNLTRDDYMMNNTYDLQYPDPDANDGVQLDHCRLYITNIPNNLNEYGLRTLFGRYGSLVHVYVNLETRKRYCFLSYETPSEAKLAMMKLNKTGPLKLNVSIAYKKRKPKETRDKEHHRDDVSSSSRNKKRRDDEFTNGEDMYFSLNESAGLSDVDVELKMEQLTLEYLKLQEALVLCRLRMLLLKQQWKRLASHKCVVCAAGTDMFCKRCAVTPYCSARCHSRDWPGRHSAVCHILARYFF